MSYAIGIDIGGTFIKYGLVDEDGAILYEGIRPTYPPDPTATTLAPPAATTLALPAVTTALAPAAVITALGRNELYENLLSISAELKELAVAKGEPPIGIGIGVPGIVDEGKVIGCQANLPELEGMALGVRMAQQLGIPVWVDNDANLMGMAEWKFGAARGLTDVIFLTIGTGIGGAMIINGQLYAGYRNRGGELGHIIIVPDGLPCSCGGRGCLEAHASVKALIEDYRECLLRDLKADPYSTQDEAKALQAATGITGRDIVARYLDNQPAARTVMNRHFDHLGSGIAGLINIFSPQKLIVGGGISEAGDFYIGQIRQRTNQRVMKETSLYTTIEAAALGNKAGFLGAAALVFNSL
jgi:glucokinase